MKAVLTRVTSASVTVDGETVGAIDCPDTGGILALVGAGREDAAARRDRGVATRTSARPTPARTRRP